MTRPLRAVLFLAEVLILPVKWVEPTKGATEHTGLNDVDESVAYCGLAPAAGDDPEGEYVAHSDPEAGETGFELNSLAKDGVPEMYEYAEEGDT